MVKDVGNPVRVHLPVTRARETLWPPAREGHELGEVGGSPCPLAEPGAQPSRHRELHRVGRKASTGDSGLLSGMAAKASLAFQSLLPAVWALRYMVFQTLPFLGARLEYLPAWAPWELAMWSRRM